ncbi:MAG TPA: Gfo/Idh/MocA family oxidoreductase [Flavisolibacter sp.]
MKLNALLIGCGNIGAGYDRADAQKVWTHARAYASLNVPFSVYDHDRGKAKEVADRYSAILMEDLREQDYGRFGMVSITTPTSTHFQYLSEAMRQDVPVIICEKPVVNSTAEALQLKELHKRCNSKILVNYIRRFQPAYREAKEKISTFAKSDQPEAISIRYHRGFLNNAGHAIDLLEFFFDQPFVPGSFHTSEFAFDAFEDDPTISGSCTFMGCPVTFTGITGATAPVFEMEITFQKHRVSITNSGNDIRYFTREGNDFTEEIGERIENILDTYMLPVIRQAIELYHTKDQPDNFMSALEMNLRVLQIIEPLKEIQCHN